MGAPKNTTSTGQPAKYSDDVGTLFVGTLIALDGTLNVTGGIKATGVLTSVGLEVNIDGAAGTNRDLEWSTTPLSDRWIARADSTAEGGANAGSNWALVAFDDTGALLGNAITVVRSTQAVTIVTGLTVTAGGATISAGSLVVTNATSTFEKDTASGISVVTDQRNLGAFNAANAVRSTWTLQNSTPANVAFADMTVTSTTPTAGAEAATLVLRTMVAGVMTTALSIGATAITTFPNGLIVAGGAVAGVNATFTQNTNAQQKVVISNLNAAGTGAYAGLDCLTDTVSFDIRSFSSGFTTFSRAGLANISGWAEVWADTNGGAGIQGLVIGVNAAKPMVFAINNAEAMRLDTAGNLVVANLGSGTHIVSAGAADSAGAGFRLLRVPN